LQDVEEDVQRKNVKDAVEEEQGNNIMISIYIYAETRIVLR